MANTNKRASALKLLVQGREERRRSADPPLEQGFEETSRSRYGDISLGYHPTAVHWVRLRKGGASGYNDAEGLGSVADVIAAFLGISKAVVAELQGWDDDESLRAEVGRILTDRFGPVKRRKPAQSFASQDFEKRVSCRSRGSMIMLRGLGVSGRVRRG